MLDLCDGNGNPGVSEVHGDAAAHGAGTDHAHGANVANWRVLGQAFHLRDFPLGKERVNQPGTLGRFHALHKQFTLSLHALLERQAESGFHRIHALERGKQAPRLFLQAGAELFKNVATLVGVQLIGQVPYATDRLAFVRNFLCVCQACSLDIAAVLNRINNAQGQSVFSAHKFAGGNHFQGLLGTRQARQALGAPGSRQQAQLHFR